jgi:RNA polymerase sigma-70 factor (ECF subfamily)
MTPVTDNVNAIQNGDARTFSVLFETYADRIYRLALGLVQDEAQAEDVVQDTFLKVMTRGAQFEGRSDLGTWLYRVAYIASMDRLRQRQTELLPDEDTEDNKSLPLPAVLTEWQTPEKILLNNEHRTQMQAAMSHLPQGLRVVFFLRDIETVVCPGNGAGAGTGGGYC